jgi:hypothetical protein
MANYWAIAIGINQYQHFQPLIYAQRDAQGFRNFLVDEAGFAPDSCLVITDSAIAYDQPNAYPSRSKIQARIMQLSQQLLRSGDVLWCFFSGYGVRFGGKDYLMPIEGDPADIAKTGIAVETLYRFFRAAPTQNIVVVLDVNRSQSVLAGEGFGQQTAELAKESGIATLLSCQPDQFSHETLALRQGIFTAALIEGMRYRGCVTLEHLVQHLSDRLPELSEHHWRPPQDPYAIVPPEKSYLLLVPEQAAVHLGNQSMALIDENTQRYLAWEGSPTPGVTALPSSSSTVEIPASPAALLEQVQKNHPQFFNSPSQSPANPPLKQAGKQSRRQSGLRASQASPAAEDLFLKRLITWGGIVGLILLAGVLLRNYGMLMKQGTTSNSFSAVQAGGTSSSVFNASPDSLDISIAADSPFAPIVLALQNQQYEDAKRMLDQIPVAERTGAYDTLLVHNNRGLLASARAMLNRVRATSSQNQASDFVEAMRQARLIQSGQAFYAEAQQDIDRWSQVIFDMAQGRANRVEGTTPNAAADNYHGAIMIAHLVPADRPALHAEARKAIEQWSRALFGLANQQAQQGSYDLAIQVAELIPPNTSIYAEAQEVIAGWRKPPEPQASTEIQLFPEE